MHVFIYIFLKFWEEGANSQKVFMSGTLVEHDNGNTYWKNSQHSP